MAPETRPDLQPQVTELQAQLASLSASYESAQAALNSSGLALQQKETDVAGWVGGVGRPDLFHTLGLTGMRYGTWDQALICTCCPQR